MILYTVEPRDTMHPAYEFSNYDAKFSEKNASTCDVFSVYDALVRTSLGQAKVAIARYVSKYYTTKRV